MLGKYIKLGGAVVGGRGRDTNRYASSGALRIAYELQGTMHRRRPWLVLVHGMGFDRSGWDPVLPALRRFRLVLLDNRGTGRSGRPDGSFNVADMAADVVAVLDAASIGRANVLGASLGGMVAQELAITRPERVARLVLACTTPGWPAAYPMPAASLRLIMATRGLPLEAARRRHTVHAVSEQAVQRDPALVGRLMEVQGVRPVNQEILSAQAMAGARYAGRLRQGRIQARTLVVHGSADTVVDPRNAKLLASCITGARLVTFSGLGHLLFWEDPDGFAAVVKSFLLDADDAGPGPGGLHAIPASSRARHDRGGVLRRRPEPDAGMITAPAGPSYGGGPGSCRKGWPYLGIALRPSWRRQRIIAGAKRLNHPLAGQMTFTYETMALAVGEGLYLIVCSVAPGSRDADALNLLASWNATGNTEITALRQT